MRHVVVIPARYKSSRLPGKPLVRIAGREMILRTWDRCVQALPADDVWIATDHEQIAGVCRDEGAQVLMTPDDCLTGTDRVHRASLQIEADVYVNVQGDEPVIDPGDIVRMLEASRAAPERILNGVCAISDEADYRSATVPKVVARPDGRLLYMSRAPLPGSKDGAFRQARRQVCIYAFPRAALADFAAAAGKTSLEASEDIEILRFLERGHEVWLVEMSGRSHPVDVPADVERIEAILSAST